MLERYLRAVVRYRIIVMLLVALATLLLASQTRQLSIVVDPDDILPQSHPLIATTNRIEALFGNRFTVVIGVHATSGTIYENGVTDRVRAITDDVLRLPGVVRANVNSIAARKSKSITGNDEGMVVKPLLGSGPAAPEALRAALRLTRCTRIYPCPATHAPPRWWPNSRRSQADSRLSSAKCAR